MSSNDDRVPEPAGERNDAAAAAGNQIPRLVVSWLIVGVPLAYGIYQTISKTLPLFGG